ncbi:MAG TPA: glucose/sorbosone family PQQ-dependent dehydrogenase [Terriglobia bacterium]|nr:glucose/sorbosone family PQQ-dependent dehydrogenase [Terriglobia bacterium]
MKISALLLLPLLSLSLALQSEPFTFKVVTTGLLNPWEVAMGPDEQLWVTERTGKRVTRVNVADGTKTTAITIDEVFQSHGQDGLLGMALHPGLRRGAASDFVYVAYTYDADPGPQLNRQGKVRRYTYDVASSTLRNPIDIITNLPAGADHLAFRLVFGPDQKLYLSVGDQGANWLQQYCNLNRAQELPTAAEVQAKDWTKYQGKMLRLNLDGTIPTDNPLVGDVRSHIYSYGHRNPQGLAFSAGGKLYASEHGPDTDDEFNLIEAGKDYGWPRVAGYIDDKVYVYASWAESAGVPCASMPFHQTIIPPSVPQRKESTWSSPDFKPPLNTFFTMANDYDVLTQGSATIAPGGLEIYPQNGPIPGWGNSALILSLKSGWVYRVKLNADGMAATGDPTQHLKSTNRYRDIALSPNGRTIFLSTDTAGSSTDANGRPVRQLANPGAIISFTYEK